MDLLAALKTAGERTEYSQSGGVYLTWSLCGSGLNLAAEKTPHGASVELLLPWSEIEARSDLDALLQHHEQRTIDHLFRRWAHLQARVA